MCSQSTEMLHVFELRHIHHIYTVVHAGDCLAGKQLGRKGPEDSGGHQVERKPAMCLCGEEG